MVDEFQDTNGVQLALIDALRGPQTRLFVVGDEFQSIYRFRHADLEVFRGRRREAEGGSRATERAAAARELPLPPGGARARSTSPARRCSATSRAAGRSRRAAPAPRGDGARRRRELLLTDARPTSPGSRPAGEPRGSSWSRPRRRRARSESPRRAFWPSACASWPTPACRAATWSCCCGPSPTSTPTRRRSSAPAWLPTSSAAAATGPSSRSRTLLRLLGVIANPLDDELLFGALASPACGVSPDALWLLRRGRPRRRDGGVRSTSGRPSRRGEWPSGDAPPRTSERLRPVLRRSSPASRARRPCCRSTR